MNPENLKNFWILSKYSKIIFEKKIDSNNSYWKSKESSQCDSPIYLSINTGNFLQIIYNNEYLENINLSNSKEDIKLIYNDKSFIVLQRLKSNVRKFRVQFLNEANKKTATESCEECVNELKKFIFVEFYQNDENGAKKLVKDPKQIIRNLIDRNEIKIPLLNNSENALVKYSNDKTLEEFLVKCLTDPNLNNYVIKTEKCLRNILKKSN